MTTTFKEKIKAIAGYSVHTNLVLRIRKNEMLTLSFSYQYEGKTGRSFKLSFQMLSLSSAEFSISELEQFCSSSLQVFISHVFTTAIKFIKVQYRIQDGTFNEININSCYGALDEPPLGKGLAFVAKLSSGMKQNVTLHGSSLNLLSWDKEESIYTDCMWKFSTFFLNTHKINEASLFRVIRFHLPLMDLNQQSYVINILPQGVSEIKPKKKVKKKKVDLGVEEFIMK